MNLLLDKSSGGERSHETPEPFHVFVAYDAPVAMQSAQRTASRLAAKTGGGARMDWNFNSFEDLRQSGPAEDAARQAAGADMVVFATINAGDLPFSTKAWIECWLAMRGNENTALLALAGSDCQAGNCSTPAQLYLESVAREAGMSFVEDRFESSAAANEGWMHTMSSRTSQMTAVMEELLRLPPHPHWGINE